MAFKLSQKSIERFDGVKNELIDVVTRAIEISTVDFGVTEGLRSIETQRKYVDRTEESTRLREGCCVVLSQH